MNYISQLIEFLQKLFVWWVTILPWERAVHVRMGKRVHILSEGMHLRIPFIDQVYTQTTRLRVMQGPPQTVTTRDGKTLMLVMAIGYTITDIEKVYRGIFHPEQSLSNMVQGAIADFVSASLLTECIPSHIEARVKEAMDSTGYGLSFEYVKVTGFAQVRTYRMIQDGHWLPDGLRMEEQK